LLLTSVACGSSEAGDNPGELGENDEVGEEKADAGKRDAGRPKDAGKDATAAKPQDAATSVLLELPCDVDRIVSEKCGTCHGSDPSAPMPLVTAKDFQAQSADNRAMYANAKAKINAVDPRTRMPPTSSDPLTQDELATLNAWLDNKAPGSNESCDKTTTDAGSADAGGGYVPADDSSLTCHRFLAHNGDGKTPLAVGVALDVYYAYVFAAPWKETSYGMVVRPIIDNKKALHHWLLFQDNVPASPPAQSRRSARIPPVSCWQRGHRARIRWTSATSPRTKAAWASSYPRPPPTRSSSTTTATTRMRRTRRAWRSASPG
jgi:mono/diheme cytochrome c family protein